VSCEVLQEREQPLLFAAVSLAMRARTAFAVLDPTWPQPFREMATDQVSTAFQGGELGNGHMVVFSSGSTGRPRGVLRTVESWQASVPSLSSITGITGQDQVWVPGALWSSLFLYGAFHAAAVGAQVILRDDDPTSATALHAVPSQLAGLLDRAAAGGLPHLRRVVVAGDRLSAALRQRCEEAGWRVVEYYGAAELSFVAWRADDGPLRAFPGVEIELREGVVWARSPYLAVGYLAPGADGPFRRDPLGWATVGDLARMKPSVTGGLEVLGRGDAVVTTGGHTVVVEEVEKLLRLVPGVDDVAVLGVPHPRFGQILTAVVVGPAADASLRGAVATMPRPCRPRRWLRAEALPLTSTGKVRRGALPDLVARLSRP
jgi:long-chain acyl-CoA synthetase